MSVRPAEPGLSVGDAKAIAAYRGSVIVFGTMHAKQRQVAPAFVEILGAHVVAPPGLDTDQFGTFTGDIPRTRTPLDAARAKARLAMTATGSSYGMASEASYGPLPGLGWAGHEEILLFLDDLRGIEILEGHRSLDTPGLGILGIRATGYPEIVATLSQTDWPDQALIVRPAEGARTTDIVKGITDPIISPPPLQPPPRIPPTGTRWSSPTCGPTTTPFAAPC